MGRIYGYARVSSTEQHLDRQIEALSAYGVEDRHIIADKQSGKDFSRPGYQTLKGQLLREGDVLVIKELDRLGRNYEQIKSEWHDLRQMGVDIVVLDMPVLSTADKSDLEKVLIANIVFELLAYLAEKERIKIKTRQAEGIATAKSKGVKFGRPKAKIPANFDKEVRKWKAGEQTATETMKVLGLKRTTFYKLVKSKHLMTIYHSWFKLFGLLAKADKTDLREDVRWKQVQDYTVWSAGSLCLLETTMTARQNILPLWIEKWLELLTGYIRWELRL